jgi:hypothetical protein
LRKIVKRIAWEDLDDDLKSAIEKRTGPIVHAETMTAGQNSPVSAAVTTATGKTFVKGLPAGDRRTASQYREAAVAPLVTGISPKLLWQFEDAGWHILGYEHIDGRHADYSPGSPDPAALVPLMLALGKIEVPDPEPFKRAENRFKGYVDDPSEVGIFCGTTLQHTDWVPQNVLISASRPHLIDWAWPTVGAGWMDPAFFLLRLMACGYTVREAEAYAAQFPAFAEADPAHLDVFAAANVRMWDEIERQAAAHRMRTWMRGVVRASREWEEHRRHRS